jgi:hypothetical protein
MALSIGIANNDNETPLYKENKECLLKKSLYEFKLFVCKKSLT